MPRLAHARRVGLSDACVCRDGEELPGKPDVPEIIGITEGRTGVLIRERRAI